MSENSLVNNDKSTFLCTKTYGQAAIAKCVIKIEEWNYLNQNRKMDNYISVVE